MKTIQEALDEMTDRNRSFFKEYANDKDATITPTFLLYHENGEATVVMTSFTNDKEKVMATEAVRLMVQKDPSVFMYGFISEAWMANVNPHTDSATRRLQPSQRSDREEVVITSIFHRSGESITQVDSIIRDWESGTVTELKTKPKVEGESFESRFSFFT